MLTSEIRIAVPGQPKPKGSLRCVGRRGRVMHQLLEANRDSGPWRKTIADGVRRSWPDHQHADPGQPVKVRLTFTVERPAGHYGTGRNRRIVKDSAPRIPVTRTSYDLDKLVRLALDALQDTFVLPDDAAVATIDAHKAYPLPASAEDQPTYAEAGSDVLPWPGVVIRLAPL